MARMVQQLAVDSTVEEAVPEADSMTTRVGDLVVQEAHQRYVYCSTPPLSLFELFHFKNVHSNS